MNTSSRGSWARKSETATGEVAASRATICQRRSFSSSGAILQAPATGRGGYLSPRPDFLKGA